MNRIGRLASIAGRSREICKMEAEELEVELEDSAGMYTPLSRNDLILAMRRMEEAEGETRMMGSGRRTGAFWFNANEGLFGRFAVAV